MALPTRELQPKNQYGDTIQETPPPGTQNDPLIAKGLQRVQYIGILGLAIALIAVIGFFSRRVEYAILFAITLSVILIVFFLTL
ncbi:hypothetical protein SD80_022015 [Scytonema tolypothrichoides VB-61278]|nr:hypothetical protein SD80_022015 [Scytonema tolypothrichoides VB-61278]